MNQIDLPLTAQAAFTGLDASARQKPLLSDLFFSQRARAPDRIAAVFGDQSLTYGEMADRVEAMARGLVAAGVRPGQFVGLWMTRSLDLQVALLAILRAGAAYLPFDQAAPAERVAVCLKDAEASALIVDRTTAPLAGFQTVPVLDAASLAADGPALPDLHGVVGPDDPAYLIYTSGSTGTPKGVVISHGNICHYLQAAQTLFQLSPEDVVFQGASVAFDLSLEEIFLPYLAGARLWIASQDCLQDTETLARRMSAAGITVLDTVPTLLALLPEDVPSLRVIILGGEACPPALAAKWCRPGRHLFNSYGPTEATVVATAIEIQPGDPVTIGRPLPGYTVYVVDDQLRLVAPGGEGELLIGGPGVASGYWRRPELSAEKFIANPFAANAPDPLLYRTGDAVVQDEQGRLLFKGRIDDQVKIRGFRVELGEIEARLAEQAGVTQAAVVLRRDGELERLVAFVTLAPGASIDSAGWRQRLAATLPPYMVPAHFHEVESLPTLTSGKLNRKALAQIPLDLSQAPTEADETPANEIEALLLAAAKPLFPGQPISFDADFFLDLGGHSLIAARFVSAVRKTPSLAGLTIQNVYGARTLRAMASLLQGQTGAGLAVEPFVSPSWRRRFLCGLAQIAALPVVLSFTTAPWLGVFVAYELFSGVEHNFFREVSALLVTYAILNVGTTVIAIAGKWLVIGRTRPGRYPLWGSYYFRWWLSQRFISMIHLKWFQGTPIMRFLLRALGAKVGREAMISDFEAGAIDLIAFGADVTVGGKTYFGNAEVVGDELIIGRVRIGDDAYVGTSCVIGGDVTIGEGAELQDLTAIANGITVPAWQIWEGSPGRQIGSADAADLPARAQAGPLRRGAQALFYALMLAVLPPVSLIPIIPAFYVLDALSDVISATTHLNYLFFLPVLAWPTAMVLIVITVLAIALVRWTVLPRVAAGTYSVYSGFYMRKWAVALATELTLETLSSLYATVYMRNWYRLMGAKIGKDAEISTNLAGRYDLTEIGAKCFIADEVVLGDEDVRRGWMHLRPVRTAARVFVGNDAVVPPGSDIPEGVLIGIKSRPPAQSIAMAEGDIWFGNPPIKLPVRQRFDDVAARWTYEPSRGRRLGRAVFEAFSVSLPSMLFITFGSLAVEALAPAILDRAWRAIILQFMACSVAISFALVLSAIGVKWLVMGKYKPTVKPMWSWWALRTEAVAVMYWGMAGKVLLDHLRGTALLPWVLRLFGCKFGKGVFFDTTDITEFDCVEVGDFCAVNGMSALQTHLYEDRVMKVGQVRLGQGVSVAGGSTVLYDTNVGDYARIGPLTIVMKGEEIPAQSQWQGAPAQPV